MIHRILAKIPLMEHALNIHVNAIFFHKLLHTFKLRKTFEGFMIMLFMSLFYILVKR